MSKCHMERGELDAGVRIAERLECLLREGGRDILLTEILKVLDNARARFVRLGLSS